MTPEQIRNRNDLVYALKLCGPSISDFTKNVGIFTSAIVNKGAFLHQGNICYITFDEYYFERVTKPSPDSFCVRYTKRDGKWYCGVVYTAVSGESYIPLFVGTDARSSLSFTRFSEDPDSTCWTRQTTTILKIRAGILPSLTSFMLSELQHGQGSPYAK